MQRRAPLPTVADPAGGSAVAVDASQRVAWSERMGNYFVYAAVPDGDRTAGHVRRLSDGVEVARFTVICSASVRAEVVGNTSRLQPGEFEGIDALVWAFVNLRMVRVVDVGPRRDH